MSINEKNAAVLREAVASIRKGIELLNELERANDDGIPAGEETGPWSGTDDLAYSMAKDAQVAIDDAMVHLERSRGLYDGRLVFFHEARRYLDELDAEFGDEGNLDLDEYPEHDPLVFPADVPPEDMETIRELAKIEREHADLARRAGLKDISDVLNLDEVSSRKMDQLMKKGAMLRDQLLTGPLAMALLEFADHVEDMKKMAAHLFFLYSVERGQAEKDGKDVVEDFFYAGENMYRFAVVEQISSEDDEDEYEEEDWEEDTDDDNKD